MQGLGQLLKSRKWAMI